MHLILSTSHPVRRGSLLTHWHFSYSWIRENIVHFSFRVNLTALSRLHLDLNTFNPISPVGSGSCYTSQWHLLTASAGSIQGLLLVFSALPRFSVGWCWLLGVSLPLGPYKSCQKCRLYLLNKSMAQTETSLSQTGCIEKEGMAKGSLASAFHAEKLLFVWLLPASVLVLWWSPEYLYPGCKHILCKNEEVPGHLRALLQMLLEEKL